MRVPLKAAFAAVAMMLGLAAFASPGEARTTFYGGGNGVAIVHHGDGFRHHRGFDRDRGFYGGPRRHYRGPYYGGGSRYYRHGGFHRGGRGYYRDRGFYGRRHYDGGSRYYRHHHRGGGGVVIRLR